MERSDWAERRRSPRVAVTLRVVEDDGEATYFQYATNLSAGGLFLEGTTPRAPGERVTLVFVIPGDHTPTQVTAEVVASSLGRHRGVHLRFLERADSDLYRKLRRYVRANTEQ